MPDFKDVEDFKKWLNQVKKDKITDILIENSNLTKIQFETFLIDLFFRQNIIYTIEKYNMRSDKDKISRGSFNHTRKQAINNIIRSIYTVLLLGYYGILETPHLEPFIEGADKLNSYINLIKERKSEELDKDLNVLKELLFKEFRELSSRKSYYK